jgi:hypothetical protein
MLDPGGKQTYVAIFGLLVQLSIPTEVGGTIIYIYIYTDVEGTRHSSAEYHLLEPILPRSSFGI